jgi:hypothetical protein
MALRREFGVIVVSVRKVVPTLTSNECCDQPLDGPVLATNDTRFILVPAGAVRLAVVCSRHCIAWHRGARRGGYKQEGRGGLASKVPEVLIEASVNIAVRAECVCVCVVIGCPSPLPCGWGITPPFIGQVEGDLQACCTILLV